MHRPQFVGQCMDHHVARYTSRQVRQAMCASQAAEVYELDDTGYNSMGEFTVVDGQEDAARLGASWCPEGAITVIE